MDKVERLLRLLLLTAIAFDEHEESVELLQTNNLRKTFRHIHLNSSHRELDNLENSMLENFFSGIFYAGQFLLFVPRDFRSVSIAICNSRA